MGKKMNTLKIIGIVLLIVGAVVLVWGAYDLIAFNTSSFGKGANKLARAFGSQTEVVRNSIIKIVAGAACAAVGFVLYRKR